MSNKYTSRRQTLQSRQATDKPPKLRFRPGIIVREKGSLQLYCVRVVYRLKENPHEWIYVLEYRSHVGNPSTELSTLCGDLSGDPKGMDACVVLWQPLYSSLDYSSHDLCRNMYHYGDSKAVTNKEMLNNYEVVSSGVIE